MSKYKVKHVCNTHKTTFCICYCCNADLFCVKNAYYCPYCDISKYVTPRYIREVVRDILDEYPLIK